ncbi:MAG TPA: hypothetical protein VFN98_07290 [Nitrososphaeraceae archaeon]|nr:hypothetical protein [Nitrososphaeraceae archaeon]
MSLLLHLLLEYTSLFITDLDGQITDIDRATAAEVTLNRYINSLFLLDLGTQDKEWWTWFDVSISRTVQ